LEGATRTRVPRAAGPASYDCNHSRADHITTPSCRPVRTSVVGETEAVTVKAIAAQSRISVQTVRRRGCAR
jgi:hypothetical protein